MNIQRKNLSRAIEIIKRNQIEILKLKITATELKTYWICLFASSEEQIPRRN
jgi:hypothetical protein